MALIINTNVSSLFAQQYLAQNQTNLSNTLQRLSSGKRINNASDDPAGLAIASTMLANVNGLNVGSRNGQDGVNLVATAAGAMQVILNDLQTMNQLAVQAANGTNGSQDRANLDAQYQALLSEIGRITTQTNFNNVSILGGGSISIQIGSGNTSNDQITVNLTNTSTGSAGLNIAGTDLTSATNASTAIGSLNLAIAALTTGLATIGADSANLQAAIQSNNAYATNLTAAQSAIMDADYAAESANMAKFTILSQSDVAMLSQANSAPSLVLQLLRQ
ncbi:Flagellin [Aquicella siphonis]|uniref:Flagellin n=1 Tax=Aquicella siphonis TaxID=254247 RepID=A0A5E4PJ94_9COXI|nr:flagellin [Aquicella siphonis]VVC77090.1 Flagellin [Aquicella siphonis]